MILPTCENELQGKSVIPKIIVNPIVFTQCYLKYTTVYSGIKAHAYEIGQKNYSVVPATLF